MKEDVAVTSASTLLGNLRQAMLSVATLTVMFMMSLLSLIIAMVTLFQWRSFYGGVMGGWLGSMVLAIWGVKLTVHNREHIGSGQVVYVSNHSSSLDVFILLALKLPQTRFFMKGAYRALPPIAVIGWLMGTFWTVPQSRPAERVTIFKNAETALRRSGEAVFLSPEGTRITSGEIGAFNKGAFHLATALSAPIVPLFINIPQNIYTGKELYAMPGTVEVHILPPISTNDWRLEDVELNRDRVRALFVDEHQRLHSTNNIGEGNDVHSA